MMTLIIAAAAAAAQPATPAPTAQAPQAQHEHGQPAGDKDMDCCKDCCKDMADASKAKPCCAEHDKAQAAHNSH